MGSALDWFSDVRWKIDFKWIVILLSRQSSHWLHDAAAKKKKTDFILNPEILDSTIYSTGIFSLLSQDLR